MVVRLPIAARSLPCLCLFSSANPIHPISGLGPWTAINSTSFCLMVSRSAFLVPKATLCGGKLALRTYFSALESAVYPLFTRISSFLPLSSTSMFPISFFNLVDKFLPSNFTSFPTRSNVLTIRPAPVAKKSTLLPPAYHSQQVLSVVLQLCTSFYLPSSSAVFSKSHLLGDEVDLYG